ncbi:MAG: methionine adenosyltransferase [Candidatus Nanosalina sp.]
MEFLEYNQVDEDPVKKRRTELVERKGLGHPDSICDGIAENVSRHLSREYRERTGHVLHHNTDEVQLVAGNSNPEYGGGELIEPIHILLTGRATREFEGEEIPVDEIALRAAREYIKENFKALSPENIEFDCRIGETSTDLKSIFSETSPASNDTSFGVGHAPLSPTEKVVRELENRIHTGLDEVGEDVKTMGLRQGEKLKLTVAAAVIAERVSGIKEYREVLEKIREESSEFVREKTVLEPEVHVNTADDLDEGSVYITETGTSAEMGDDGSVGRGNRVNGLITPHRSMSLEAASGKNPVSHVGKIYNILANQIAQEVSDQGFAEVKMLSQIGVPLDQPQTVEVESTAQEEKVREVVKEKLSDPDITDSAIKGEINTF